MCGGPFDRTRGDGLERIMATDAFKLHGMPGEPAGVP